MELAEGRSGQPLGTGWKILRLSGLPILWAATVLLMVRNYFNDPFDPALQGTRAYGHNYEGALWQGLLASAIELAVVLAILRPWSYRRSWIRAMVAVALFTPWMLFSMLLTMHAGGVVAIHWWWLLAVVLVLMTCLIWSIVGRARTS